MLFLDGGYVGVFLIIYLLSQYIDNEIVAYNATRKEGKVLFNNALNIFYLRLYGARHIVKDHSDSEEGRKFNDTLNTFYFTVIWHRTLR